MFEIPNPKKDQAAHYWRMVLFALIGSFLVVGFMVGVASGAGPNHY